MSKIEKITGLCTIELLQVLVISIGLIALLWISALFS